MRTVLVALEVGLSTVCLAAAALLLNSFVRLTHIDKGFDAEHVMSVELYLAGARYSGSKRDEFLRKTIEAIQPLPGVTAMGVVNMLPLTGEGNNNLLIVEGVNVPLFERPLVDMRSVNGDYFHAMGIPLRAGRVFEESDRKRGVAIVGESTARKLWPGENPVGKRVRFGEPTAPLMEVVGIAGDVRGNGLQKAPEQVVYVPYWYRGRSQTSLVIRTGMDPKSIAGAVRAELRKLDPELPVPQFQTMQDIVSASVAVRKFQLSLVLVFASIALVLACLGIFGVVSYTVAQRRGEMGIRSGAGSDGWKLEIDGRKAGAGSGGGGFSRRYSGGSGVRPSHGRNVIRCSPRRSVDIGGRFAAADRRSGRGVLHSGHEGIESGSADRATLRISWRRFNPLAFSNGRAMGCVS